MTARADFVRIFGGVFEHSPFIAERAYDAGFITVPLTARRLHDGMVLEFRNASREERLGVLRAHPDLAGRLAIAGDLTEDSRQEQAGAGLDRLTAEEYARFNELNDAYRRKFGFPFIIAVKGLDRNDILAAFERRIGNGFDEEFDTAAQQVERIALLRLQALLPGP
ncbi:2-oxo-4-hydroxy-4-carboxy-5-ureidoimidazoline decarboxylase [Neorhizobium sp. NPDC001467]|uniref:2-oxo-4-hydroxy-4-carboxy-5-ureidoimidazoline decarboxylase n=1 Tax=Neorhizobium sp. NPDC001467 TaxID=3390595 RepID=UPI003D05B456